MILLQYIYHLIIQILINLINIVNCTKFLLINKKKLNDYLPSITNT